MNKKGQAVIVFIMVGIIVFIMASQFITPIKNEVTTTMNSSSLNCSSSDISTVDRATCTIIDMGFFYFLSVCIAVGIALVAGRRTITGVLTSIFVFVLVVALITPLKELIINARTSLSCGTAGLAVGNSMLCIFVDLWLFYFVVTAISAGITWATVTRVLPQIIGEE